MDTTERGPGGLDWTTAQRTHPARRRRRPRGAAPPWSPAPAPTNSAPHDPNSPRSSTPTPNKSNSFRPRAAPAVLRVSHALVSAARSADDYLSVYRDVLAKADRPAIVHWLGHRASTRPSPATGATHDPVAAMEVVVQMARENADHLDGIKFSLLDHELEEEFRRRLPAGRQGLHRRRLRLHRSAARRRRAPQSRTPRRAGPDRTHRIGGLRRTGRR